MCINSLKLRISCAIYAPFTACMKEAKRLRSQINLLECCRARSGSQVYLVLNSVLRRQLARGYLNPSFTLIRMGLFGSSHSSCAPMQCLRRFLGAFRQSSQVWLPYKILNRLLQPSPLPLYLMFPVRGPYVQKDQTILLFTSHILYFPTSYGSFPGLYTQNAFSSFCFSKSDHVWRCAFRACET